MTPDVPGGDAFKTINMYSISHVSANKCRLIVTGEIQFLKYTFVKAFVESFGTSGFVQYGADLHITLEKRISVDSGAPANQKEIAGPSAGQATLAPSTTSPDSTSTAPAVSAGEPDDTTQKPGAAAASAPSLSTKLQYYKPYFEILAFLIVVLFLNLLVFGSLRQIQSSVISLEQHAVQMRRGGRVASTLLSQVKLPDGSPASQLSALLAMHLDDVDSRVIDLTHHLSQTQELLTEALLELKTLKSDRQLIQTGLSCLTTGDPGTIKDPKIAQTCKEFIDNLDRETSRGHVH